MFSKVALFAVATFALLVAGGPIPQAGSGSINQCNNGQMLCCSEVNKSNTKAGADALALASVPVQNAITTVGSNCNPITSGGPMGGAAASGAKCAAQPVCCNQSYLSGLVGNSCIPINEQIL
uniref:Hydrophobin n=1 Tax=Tricholoma vaccinum TaxID=56470 RepID=A0A024BLI8_9AGAR|nr:hydrophobin 9 [Tricholoma vaccinum]